MSASGTSAALAHAVSGSTSVAPRRLKKRPGKPPAIIDRVPV